MVVPTADPKPILAGERRDPDVVLRDWSAARPELFANVSVVPSGV
jgi:hypothetical protein